MADIFDTILAKTNKSLQKKDIFDAIALKPTKSKYGELRQDKPSFFEKNIRPTLQTLGIVDTPLKSQRYLEVDEPAMGQWARLGFPSEISKEEKPRKGKIAISPQVGKLLDKYKEWMKTPKGKYLTAGEEGTKAMDDLGTVASIGAIAIMGIGAIQQVVNSPYGQLYLSKISNSPLIQKIMGEKVSAIELKNIFGRVTRNQGTVRDIRIWEAVRQTGEFAKASKHGIKIPRFGWEGFASRIAYPGLPSPYTQFHAGVPAPRPGDVVSYAGQAYKVANITGNVANLISAGGQQIQAKLSELTAGGKPETKPPPPIDIPPPPVAKAYDSPEGRESLQSYEKQKDIWFGNKDVRLLQNQIEKRNNQKSLKTVFNKKGYDKEVQDYDHAIDIYIDTKRNPGHIEKYYNRLTPEQKKIVDLSQNLPEPVKALADKIGNSYKTIGLEAQSADVIRNVLDNYVGRVWDIEQKVGSEAYRKFGTTTRHARARKFGTKIEGWANGYKQKVKGATSNLEILKNELVKTIEDKKFIKSLTNLKDVDGNPLLSIQHLEGYKRVDHPNFKVWRPVGKAPETEATGPLRGRNFFRDEEGMVWERKELYAPKDIAKNMNNILGISKLKGIPAIDVATKYNAIIKAWILQTSFFHHLAFMRSYWLGTNHKKWNELSPRQAYRQGIKAIEEENPVVMLGVKNGLTLGLKQDWNEELLKEKTAIGNLLDRTKVSKDIKNKVVNLREQQASFLFGEFGAGLKAKSFIIEFRNMTKKYPNKDPDEIAKMVANLINDDFGGLHLQRMGRNPTVQHLFRLFALAPDWTESNVRTMIKVFKAGGKEEANLYRRFWAGILTKGAILTVLGNALMAGLEEDDKDTKGLLQKMIRNYKRAWKEGRMLWMDVDITAIYKMLGGKADNRKYFSLLGHFKDPIKFISHPIRSAQHKGSIIYRFFHEALSGVDWAGRRFTTTPELLGIDKDKGLYKTTRKGKYKKGDPKWGKLKGKTVVWDYSKRGPLEFTQIPSFILSNIKGWQPIQVQNLLSWLAGEMEGFDASFKSMGVRVKTTYGKKEETKTEKKPEKKKPIKKDIFDKITQ